MVVMAVAAVVSVLLARWIARSWRELNEQHAMAGRFGEPQREQALQRLAARVLATAESTVRLADFHAGLATRAWNGTVLRVTPTSSTSCEWAFADGSTWHVRHSGQRCAHLARVVVQNAVVTPTGLEVRVYPPGCATRTIRVSDAQRRSVTAGAATGGSAR